MTKKIILIILLLAGKQCFCQNKIIDSLKGELVKKSDANKLPVYFELSNATDGENNLMYLEPVWELVDKLLLTEKNEAARSQFIETENSFPAQVIFRYSSQKMIDWNKTLPYFNNRLQTIEKTKDKKRQAKFLFTMAGLYLDYKRDSATFRPYILKSIALSKEIKDSALIVLGYRYMYSFYRSAGSFAQALEAVQSSVAICRELNYKKGTAESLSELAQLYTDFKEDESALNNYQTSLGISYALKDTEQISNTLTQLSDFYSTRHNLPKAIAYMHQVMELNRSNSKMEGDISWVYWTIGQVYSENKDYKNALLYFDTSLRKADEAKNIDMTSWALYEIGNVYRKQGDFKKALTYHTRTFQILDSTGDRRRYKAYVRHILALDYFGLKNFTEAKKENDRGLVDFKRIWFDIKSPSEMEMLAYRIDSAMGDGFGALAHYKEYVSYTEKIKGEEIKTQAQKDIFKTANEKQKAEQEKKDAIAARTRNLQYIIIGAFLLLGIFLLYGYNQKNKDKKRVEKAYGELKSTQAQLIQSEKMASLGELTAGIAHEIQNPLNFVNNFSEVSSELIDEMSVELNRGDIEEAKAISAGIKQNLEKINHHGRRADAIVKGMLQHSQSSKGQKEPTDINALADEYLRLAYHGLRAKDKSFNATLKTDFDETIGKVNIIPQDIGRVLLNLFTNAFYAVNLRGLQNPGVFEFDPTVSITTKQTENRLLISVSDNGGGIPKEIIDKIFQPFFTTKPTGQGTGLGLSLAYDIVKAHGGELKVETNSGEGSRFIIQLPVTSNSENQL